MSYSYFEVKVQYTMQTGEDNPKAVKESYMTDHATFGAAEQVVLEHVKPFVSDVAETISMKKLKVYETFRLEDGLSHIYCGKVKFFTIDDSGTEKSVVNRVYVGAEDLSDAKLFLQEQYKGYDAELVGIEETKMVEYVNPAPDGQDSAD